MAPHHFDIVFARRADDAPPPRFLTLIEREAHARGMIFVHCGSHAQAETIRHALIDGTLSVGCLIDYMGRSFRADEELGREVRDRGGLVIVDPNLVRRFGDKASMHAALTRAGVPLPSTIIWPADRPSRSLTPAERRLLGGRIVCKPARGSGASGVLLAMDGSHAALEEARDHDPDDDYLLQEFVTPVSLDGRPAWFRVYNCFGRVLGCWWHPETHATSLVHPAEAERYQLGGLERISRTIAAISGYTWFSTEIAVAERAGRRLCLPIDYLNNKCYMLTHSEVGERGLPDELAETIAWELVERAASHIHRRTRDPR